MDDLEIPSYKPEDLRKEDGLACSCIEKSGTSYEGALFRIPGDITPEDARLRNPGTGILVCSSTALEALTCEGRHHFELKKLNVISRNIDCMTPGLYRLEVFGQNGSYTSSKSDSIFMMLSEADIQVILSENQMSGIAKEKSESKPVQAQPAPSRPPAVEEPPQLPKPLPRQKAPPKAPAPPAMPVRPLTTPLLERVASSLLRCRKWKDRKISRLRAYRRLMRHRSCPRPWPNFIVLARPVPSPQKGTSVRAARKRARAVILSPKPEKIGHPVILICSEPLFKQAAPKLLSQSTWDNNDNAPILVPILWKSGQTPKLPRIRLHLVLPDGQGILVRHSDHPYAFEFRFIIITQPELLCKEVARKRLSEGAWGLHHVIRWTSCPTALPDVQEATLTDQPNLGETSPIIEITQPEGPIEMNNPTEERPPANASKITGYVPFLARVGLVVQTSPEVPQTTEFLWKLFCREDKDTLRPVLQPTTVVGPKSDWSTITFFPGKNYYSECEIKGAPSTMLPFEFHVRDDKLIPGPVPAPAAGQPAPSKPGSIVLPAVPTDSKPPEKPTQVPPPPAADPRLPAKPTEAPPPPAPASATEIAQAMKEAMGGVVTQITGSNAQLVTAITSKMDSNQTAVLTAIQVGNKQTADNNAANLKALSELGTQIATSNDACAKTAAASVKAFESLSTQTTKAISDTSAAQSKALRELGTQNADVFKQNADALRTVAEAVRKAPDKDPADTEKNEKAKADAKASSTVNTVVGAVIVLGILALSAIFILCYAWGHWAHGTVAKDTSPKLDAETLKLMYKHEEDNQLRSDLEMLSRQVSALTNTGVHMENNKGFIINGNVGLSNISNSGTIVISLGSTNVATGVMPIAVPREQPAPVETQHPIIQEAPMILAPPVSILTPPFVPPPSMVVDIGPTAFVQPFWIVRGRKYDYYKPYRPPPAPRYNAPSAPHFNSGGKGKGH